MEVEYTINGLVYIANVEVWADENGEVYDWDYEEEPFYTNNKIDNAVSYGINKLEMAGEFYEKV